MIFTCLCLHCFAKMVLFYDISQMLQILTQVMVLYVIETEHVFEVTPVLRK